MVLLEGEKLSK